MILELGLMKEQLRTELARVLEFWERTSVHGETGCFLTLSCDNKPLEDGRRSSVLMSRILWAYSAAYQLTGAKAYLDIANQAYAFLQTYFVDNEKGGVYELLDGNRKAVSKEKVIYTQSYAIYACAEYSLASGNQDALNFAKTVFEKIETHAYSEKIGAYLSACEENWLNAKENILLLDTQMHLLEAYTVLYKAWPDTRVRKCLVRLKDILLKRFLRENGALYQELRFDWTPTGDTSDRFGDESECVWMLCEMARLIDDDQITKQVNESMLRMVNNILVNGYDREHGGIFDRRNSDGSICKDKLWWEESETVVALLYAYQLCGRPELLKKAFEIWQFIRRFILDEQGEWNWKVRADGSFVVPDDPSDPLKCPYHNTRLAVLAIPILEQEVSK